MREVRESPATEATLDRLWEEGRDSLVETIEGVKDWVEQGNRRARQARYAAPPLDGPDWVWIVTVHDHGEDWLIAWSDLPDTEPPIAVTHSVQPSSPPRGR